MEVEIVEGEYQLFTIKKKNLTNKPDMLFGSAKADSDISASWGSELRLFLGDVTRGCRNSSGYYNDSLLMSDNSTRLSSKRYSHGISKCKESRRLFVDDEENKSMNLSYEESSLNNFESRIGLIQKTNAPFDYKTQQKIQEAESLLKNIKIELNKKSSFHKHQHQLELEKKTFQERQFKFDNHNLDLKKLMTQLEGKISRYSEMLAKYQTLQLKHQRQENLLHARALKIDQAEKDIEKRTTQYNADLADLYHCFEKYKTIPEEQEQLFSLQIALQEKQQEIDEYEKTLQENGSVICDKITKLELQEKRQKELLIYCEELKNRVSKKQADIFEKENVLSNRVEKDNYWKSRMQELSKEDIKFRKQREMFRKSLAAHLSSSFA